MILKNVSNLSHFEEENPNGFLPLFYDPHRYLSLLSRLSFLLVQKVRF